MTVLQLQLNDKRGFMLTTPEHADDKNVKLLEGELTVNNNSISLQNVRLATMCNKNIHLNREVLTNHIGDLRLVVQQLRYFAQVFR